MNNSMPAPASTTNTTTKGLLILMAVFVFSKIYYVIHENKKYRNTVAISLTENRGSERTIQIEDVNELPYLFAAFILLLTGMPILR
jgi:hypothetical protein